MIALVYLNVYGLSLVNENVAWVAEGSCFCADDGLIAEGEMD